MQEEQTGFREKLNKQLDDLEAQLHDLGMKGRIVGEELKNRYGYLLDEVEPGIDKAKEKLKEFGRIAEELFDDLKDNTKSAGEDFENAFRKMRAQFEKEKSDNAEKS